MATGMTEEEANAEIQSLKSKQMEERMEVLQDTIRTNSNDNHRYFRPTCLADCQGDNR